jgi:hypothetical protein
MKNKVHKIKSNVLKQMWEPHQKGSARLSMSKEKIWNILLLACDYKTSKIKVKIEENQSVFTYHLGWMLPQRRRTKLVGSATNI